MIRRCLGTLPATWPTTDATSPTTTQEERLRSADTLSTLLVSRTRTNFGDRDFSAAGPRVWNYLPTDLRQPDLSYSRFRQSLKTFLFGVHLDHSALWTLSFRPLTALELLLTNLITYLSSHCFYRPSDVFTCVRVRMCACALAVRSEAGHSIVCCVKTLVVRRSRPCYMRRCQRGWSTSLSRYSSQLHCVHLVIISLPRSQLYLYMAARIDDLYASLHVFYFWEYICHRLKTNNIIHFM